MSLAALRSNMAAMAQMAADGLVQARHATVSTGHSTEYAVKVFLEPEHIETNFIPVLTPFVGNGWGLFCKPCAGDQVLVVFAEGDINSGVVIGGLFSDADRPLPVPERELWIAQKTGSFVKLLADGTVTAQSTADSFISLAPDGSIHSKGAWHHDGDFHATQTITGDTDVVAAGISGKGHHHPVEHVQGGSSTINSDPPQN